MTHHEVSKLHNILKARVIELDRSTRQRDALVIEGTADDFDRRLHAIEREVAARNLEVAFTMRREAYGALRRMQEGAYGVCRNCEQAISPARLAALPWAELCVRCQQAEDGPKGKGARQTLAIAA
jgi:DnaK suppressor protein